MGTHYCSIQWEYVWLNQERSDYIDSPIINKENPEQNCGSSGQRIICHLCRNLFITISLLNALYCCQLSPAKKMGKHPNQPMCRYGWYDDYWSSPIRHFGSNEAAGVHKPKWWILHDTWGFHFHGRHPKMDGLEWKTMEHLVELDDGGISVFLWGETSRCGDWSWILADLTKRIMECRCSPPGGTSRTTPLVKVNVFWSSSFAGQDCFSIQALEKSFMTNTIHIFSIIGFILFVIWNTNEKVGDLPFQGPPWKDCLAALEPRQGESCGSIPSSFIVESLSAESACWDLAGNSLR